MLTQKIRQLGPITGKASIVILLNRTTVRQSIDIEFTVSATSHVFPAAVASEKIEYERTLAMTFATIKLNSNALRVGRDVPVA